MPRYDYKCTKCGHEEDRIVSIKDRNKQKCEERVAVAGRTLPPRKLEKCKGKLERVEEISNTGNMKVQWAGWAD